MSYYQNNKKEICRKMRLLYRLKHPIVLRKKRSKNEILIRRRKRENARIKNDPIFRLKRNVGNIIYLSLKTNKAGRKWEELVGYSLKKLKDHLEFKFQKGMNWNNYGNQWHLDHIKPRSLFIIKSKDCPEFKKCWSLDNLQPLWAKENMSKGNRYITA